MDELELGESGHSHSQRGSLMRELIKASRKGPLTTHALAKQLGTSPAVVEELVLRKYPHYFHKERHSRWWVVQYRDHVRGDKSTYGEDVVLMTTHQWPSCHQGCEVLSHHVLQGKDSHVHLCRVCREATLIRIRADGYTCVPAPAGRMDAALMDSLSTRSFAMRTGST